MRSAQQRSRSPARHSPRTPARRQCTIRAAACALSRPALRLRMHDSRRLLRALRHEPFCETMLQWHSTLPSSPVLRCSCDYASSQRNTSTGARRGRASQRYGARTSSARCAQRLQSYTGQDARSTRDARLACAAFRAAGFVSGHAASAPVPADASGFLIAHDQLPPPTILPHKCERSTGAIVPMERVFAP